MSIHRRETNDGEVRWDVRLRAPAGRQYKRTFRTKKEAERFQATELADRARGSWIDPMAGRTTVADWFDEWYSTNGPSWRPATAAKNRTAIARHWLPSIGAHSLGSITPRQVQAVVNRLANEYMATTVRSYYGAFRNMMRSAVEMELIGRTPCRGIKLPSGGARDKRVIRPRELHALAEAIGSEWRSMIYLAGVMALRFGEVAALQVGDVDLGGGRLSITKAVSESGGSLRIAKPKTTASSRSLDLPAPIVDELRQHIDLHGLSDPHDLLFADNFGGPLRASNFRGRIFVPAVERAELHGLTFHGLRHSAATIWMAAGADARTVQRLLGHTDPSLVLRLYAHASDDAVRRAGDLAARFYWDEPTDQPGSDDV